MYRSARTVVFSQTPEAIVGYNFLTKDTFSCDTGALDVLQELSDWTEISDLAGRHAEVEPSDIEAGISELVHYGAIVKKGSRLEVLEDEFFANWQWGFPAAMLHFGVEGRKYLTLEDNRRIQEAKLGTGAPPPLFRDNSSFKSAVELPEPDKNSALFKVICNRRTNREVQPFDLPLNLLSEALFAGLGIVGFTQTVAGFLPLKVTPSGGARNPYEAYVYAKTVDGLRPGLYHYSAIDHTLGLVKDLGKCPSASALIADQDWMDHMSCVVFLCAELDRTMWKYDDPNAYRVILVEAGHIAQNIMLAVTAHGLTACPSAALDHAAIKKACDLEKMTSTPVYALGIGKPANAQIVHQVQDVIRFAD